MSLSATPWNHDPEDDAMAVFSSDDSGLPVAICESHEDAKLIAAAPGLLDALRWLVKVAPDESDMDPSNYPLGYGDAIANAVDAIAKAEGQA